MDMTPIPVRFIAGVAVPDTRLVASAIEYARQHFEDYLYNHVVRSWLLAARMGQLRGIEHDAEVVALGRCCTTSRSTSVLQGHVDSKWKARTWLNASQATQASTCAARRSSGIASP